MPCLLLVTRSDEVFGSVRALGKASAWEIRRQTAEDILPVLHDVDAALFDLLNDVEELDALIERVGESTPFLPLIFLSNTGASFPDQGSGLRYHVDPNRLYDLEHILISLSLSSSFDLPPRIEDTTNVVPRLLIVDDNVQLAATIGRAFRSLEKYDVKVTSSGFEAIALLPTFAPDVVVVDLVLNDMDGRDLCAYIRGHEKLAHTKVIAMSGYISKDRVEDQCKSLQFDAFLEKPFRMKDILGKVTAFLK